MLVVCAGMPRSASTWQYQVASELVERKGLGLRAGFVPSSTLRPATEGWQVVKWHDADPGYAAALASGAARALYSYRDLRDVVFSAMHKTATDFDELVVRGRFVETAIANDAFWRSQPGVLAQEYDAILSDPCAGVRAIAAHLGIAVDEGEVAAVAAACSAAANRARAAQLREELASRGVDLADPRHALRHDGRTQVHWNHIRDGAPGWRELATPAQRRELRDRCGSWLIANGYERDTSWARPRLSVVIPVLNRADYIAATIDSVLSQDYPEIEVVVADGGSTDGTLDVLRSYGDRICWFSEPDRGPFDAINKGWAQSTGDIVAWLNADDTYTPGAVSRAMAYFEQHPEVDVVHGTCLTTTPSGAVLWTWGSKRWDYVQNVLDCSCTVDQPAAFMRRTAVERVGGVQDIAVLDFDLWIRMSAAGSKFLAVPDHFANAVDHPQRITNRPEVMVPAVVETIRRAVNDPAAPPELRMQSRRALSAAYRHGFYFAGRRRWDWVARYAWNALRTDPASWRAVAWSLIEALQSAPGFSMTARLAVRAARFARWHLRDGVAVAQVALLLLVLRRLGAGR
jgi:glycosyltransferase involved in cell wall biosynthesis